MTYVNMLTANTDNFWLRIIYIVSVIISGAVAFLILGPRPAGIEGSLDAVSYTHLTLPTNREV